MIQRVVALILVAVSLAACGAALDSDQVRTCRQTLPAVDLDADRITVMRVSVAQAPYTMRIDYRSIEKGAEHRHLVFCGFGPSPEDNSVIVLTRLATEDEIFSPLKLHILKRYWLYRHESSFQADPGPGETEVDVPEVPKALAYLVQSFSSGLPAAAMTMLLAVAYALIFGLVGRINLAFGDFAALGGVVSLSAALAMLAMGSTSLAFNLAVAALVGVGLVILNGHIVERLVFAPLAFRRGQTILIATVGVSLIMREAMRLMEGAQNRWAPPIPSSSFPLVKADGFVANITPMQISIGIVMTTVALGVVRLMRRSKFGRHWRATSDDAVMANLMGISSRRTLAQTFALASALAGLAGFVMTAFYGGTDVSSGAMIGLKGLIAAVIGGIGSIEGALLGGLFLGLFEMVWQAYLPIGQRDVAVMVLLVAMLIFRPGGLFGFSEASPREV